MPAHDRTRYNLFLLSLAYNGHFFSNLYALFAFTPSDPYHQTQAMLINSANVMGGGNEPDTERGFGRIHLEAGMPLNGAGDMALFVADSSDHEVYSNGKLKFNFNVDPDAGLELRATLSWNDPAASSLSGDQLINDLDLRGN